MNVLHVFGRWSDIENWICVDLLLPQSARVTQTRAKSKATVEVAEMTFTCVVINQQEWVDKLRGARFDMVMFHDSFGREMYRMGAQRLIDPIIRQLHANCLK